MEVHTAQMTADPAAGFIQPANPLTGHKANEWMAWIRGQPLVEDPD